LFFNLFLFLGLHLVQVGDLGADFIERTGEVLLERNALGDDVAEHRLVPEP